MNRRTLLAGASLLPFAAQAQTEGFPARAVSMVVAFPPGGQADVVGRPSPRRWNASGASPCPS